MNKEYFNGVGRRKNSTARVYLSDGKGKFSINNVSDDINSYLKRESLVIHAVKPLEVLNLKGKYDIKINVQGGGLTGQAGAIQLGIARALLKIDEEFRSQLKSHGLLTRDAREVERKNMVNQELERSSNSQKDKSMQKITKEDLLNSGAHFGHVSSKTDPNFKDFVVSQKNGIDIINLDDTLEGLDKALNFISNIVQRNGEILFVGTKKHAKDVIQQEADRCGMFYVVERWLGGTLTNFSTIKKVLKDCIL